MSSEKRRPIRNRIMTTVLLIAAASLIATSLFGVISMIGIQKESEDALTEQAMANLQEVIRGKTLLANQRLQKYSDITKEFAYYAEEIMNNPEQYNERDVVMPTVADTAGTLTIQIAMAHEDMQWDDIRDIARLYANVEPRFYPVMQDNTNVITTVYFGTTDNIIVCYDVQSDVKAGMEYYNFFETSWYKLCEEKQDIAFTPLYPDGFGRGLTITCVCPLHGKNGEFRGVIGVDILINDLYSEIIDIDLGEGGKVFIADNNNEIISPDPTEVGSDMTEGRSSIQQSDIERAANYPSGIVAREGLIFAFNTIESVNWKLFARVPQSSVLELANTIGQNIVTSIIVFSVFFLFVLSMVIVVVLEVSKRITDPLSKLTDDVKEMSGGNLDHRAVKYVNDEVGDLSDSFNEMAGSLKDHIERVTKMTADKERISAELNVATRIQADMMPRNFPKRDDFSLYASMTPAKEIGGDFYDFFMQDDDHLALIMADVSGKGVPAALFMVVAKKLFKVRLSTPGTLSEMVFDLNNTLCADNTGNLFVTVWLGVLTISTGKLEYINAGHEYPALRHADGSFELIMTDNFPPLATMEDIDYPSDELTLKPGDELFLYTDGVPEAKDPRGERFGTDKMLEVLNRFKDDSTEKQLTELKAEVDAFTGSNDPFDDVTMLGMKYNGK